MAADAAAMAIYFLYGPDISYEICQKSGPLLLFQNLDRAE